MIKIYFTYANKLKSHEFLHYVFKNYYNIDLTLYELKKTKHGKLYVENFEYKFNISHSDNLIGIAITNEEIGFDIEKIREINYKKLTKRYFGNEVKTLNEFFTLWTTAEGYVKFKADSLLPNLNDIQIVDNQIIYKNEKQSLFIKSGEFNEYIYTVITNSYKKIEVITCTNF